MGRPQKRDGALAGSDTIASIGKKALIGSWQGEPPRAAGFIVTIYGDVVEPRGGVLWIGNLIEICNDVGISESLVRTAVSRLVSSNRLVGERVGRRSFYRLTPDARIEFLAAAKILFAPKPIAERWRILPRGTPERDAELLRGGFALVGDLLMGVDRGEAGSWSGLTFQAEAVAGAGELPAFAAKYWDLEPLAAAYRAFLRRYGDLEQQLLSGRVLSDRASMIARLRLVHEYRSVLLRDPRLPGSALAPDWPGPAASEIFARLYERLSPACDKFIAAHFLSDNGPLEARTDVTSRRLETLSLGANLVRERLDISN